MGLGSDFGGCIVPQEIGDAAGLQLLPGMMEGAGYGGELIEKIWHRNWVACLTRILGA